MERLQTFMINHSLIFVLLTKYWKKVYDQWGSVGDRYKPNKQIRFKTSMLRSDLCDYSDVYIVVKGDIILRKRTTRNFINSGQVFSI